MPPSARTGRPRVYCSTRCRKRHGHVAERQRRRTWEPVEWTAEQAERAVEQLLRSAPHQSPENLG
jgi:hypothetical protein